jgi:hypothetical protein
MMGRRRIRDSLDVSLFPFLAVLICTFGVLIVLLVIVVKAADQQAINFRMERQLEQQQELKQWQHALDLQILRVEGLESLRPDLLKQLSDAKTVRAHLQADIDRLLAEQRLLQREAELIEQSSELESTVDHSAELAQLKQQLEDEQDLLAKRRQSFSSASKSVTYSIVPYDGPGGTHRQPVYIECRQDAIEIQPYGIRLTAADFVTPILPNNPLDAALISVREYFLKNKLTEKQGMPYPLLVVRPNGPSAYALARRAMKSWDEEFGYELIGADVTLNFGQPDAQLAREIQLAVDAARTRQRQFVAEQTLIRINNSSSGAPDPGGLSASHQYGGFVDRQGRVVQAGLLSPPNDTAGESAFGQPRAAEPAEAGTGAGPKQADIHVRGLKQELTSIAATRGANWALPAKSDRATGYRRPVKIFLANELLIIDSDSKSNRRVEIPIAGDHLLSTVDKLVEAIWQRIETWGVAGVDGYWKPELDVVVLPGGEPRFQQLQKLLQQSGLVVVEKSN